MKISGGGSDNVRFSSALLWESRRNLPGEGKGDLRGRICVSKRGSTNLRLEAMVT